MQGIWPTGAIGFVVKDRADTELPEAVRCAAHGEEYVSAHVAAGVTALRKMANGDGLSTRAELVHFALRRHLIDA